MNEEDELEPLAFFHDAIEAGTACRHLEHADIRFKLQDRSIPIQGVDRFREGPAVWIDLLVESNDLKSAQAVLRATMGLFPEREVPEGTVVDDGPEVMVQVVSCETLPEAQEIKLFLQTSNVRSEIRELREDDEFLAFSVEVTESDLGRAFLVLESSPE